MKNILMIAEEGPPFTRWVEVLTQKAYRVEIFPDIKSAAEKVLFQLPDMLLIEEKLHAELVKDLVYALKGDLSLFSLPIILILLPERITEIEWEEYLIDDFICETASEEELVSRVNLAFVRVSRLADNNPLTGLPGNTSILRRIEEALHSNLPQAVAYVDIDNFKPFNDAYGFSRGDEIIRMLARILVNTVDQYAGPHGFVGHIGGDDFVFICPLEVVEDIAREIIQKFDHLVLNFIDPEDRKRGYIMTTDRQGMLCRMPWPSVSIAIVPVWKGRFEHYGEVASVAAQIKKYLKSLAGSVYLIDRRQGSHKEGLAEKKKEQGSQAQKGAEG